MTRGLGSGGRHRAARTRLSRAQRLTAGGLLLGASAFVAATWPTAAVADAPVQTGWWNTASGGGQAAPDPATPPGGLHVSAASGQVLAYGAVLYAVPQGATATLELNVSNLAATPQINPTAPTTAPQADVVACPTKSTTWKAGDNQPADAAPGYDCTRSFFGNLSADGKTLTFLIDSSVESVPGQLSLAIVPVLTDGIPGAGTSAPTDTTQPFAMDIGKPDATSLTVTSTAALPPPPPKPTAATGATSTSAGSTPVGAGAASSGTTSTSSTGSVALPPALTGGSTGSGAADPGTTPVVAPANSAPAATPAAAAAPTTNNRAHNAALAMLLLIGMGIVAMSSGQMQRAPRLLGGTARHSSAAAAAAAAALPAAAVAPMATYGNRGLGRFTKPRTEPARPLT